MNILDITKKNYKIILFWIAILAIIIFVDCCLRLYLFSEENKIKKIEIEQKVFGYSVLGKPINGYEIGNGANIVLLIGATHGNERGSGYLLNKLVAEIKNDTKIISKNKKIIIIPIVNPDGYAIYQKFNANGVNLNLNFGTIKWENYGPQGTYAGSVPFSEIESQTIKKVVEQYSPTMMISYHASGAIVVPEEGASSMALAKWYAKKTGYIYYDDASAIVDNLNWDFPGTATKWFVESTGKPAITVELTSLYESDWEINKNVLLDIISSDIINYN